MKILISSRYLADNIRRAIEADSKTILLVIGNNQMIFESLTKKINLEVHVIEYTSNNGWMYPFKSIKMYQLMTFLESIPEQPIVVEFQDIIDNDFKIELSQFVYIF